MEDLLPQLDIPNEWKIMLIQSCYLHDIGYSDRLNYYQFHPLDGAILFHSCAFEAIKNNRTDLLNIYQDHYKLLDAQDHLFIDLVTYCDIHTSPRGESITLEQRINDVVNRYVSRLMVANRSLYENAIFKVNNLIG